MYLSLVLKFLHHAIQLINTECFLKDSHFFNEVNFRAGPPQHLVLVFVLVNLEDVLGGVVGETRVQEKGVRHVPQI